MSYQAEIFKMTDAEIQKELVFLKNKLDHGINTEADRAILGDQVSINKLNETFDEIRKRALIIHKEVKRRVLS